jgi:hypothetical protein
MDKEAVAVGQRQLRGSRWSSWRKSFEKGNVRVQACESAMAGAFNRQSHFSIYKPTRRPVTYQKGDTR